MTQDILLLNLLQRYLDSEVGLDAVHGYVSLRVGEVDDKLVDLVAMDIWQFRDGFVQEEQLRTRLAEILTDVVRNVVYFDSLFPEEHVSKTTTSAVFSSYQFNWPSDRPEIIRAVHSFT